MIRKRHGILFLALITLIGINLIPCGHAGPQAAEQPKFGKISGRVVDERTAEPIAFATVQVDGTALGAAADLKGYFTIMNVPPGTYSVRATCVGYAVMIMTDVEVKANRVAGVDFLLKASEIKGDTVWITCSNDPADLDVTSNKRIVGKVEGIRRSATTASEAPSLEVDFAKRGDRGGRSGEVLTIVDGIVPPPLYPGWNSEQYARVDENGFFHVTNDPLSTFSIDVDAASYANMRRFLNQGRLPPPDAVRIEEFINYFTYDYPQPDENVPFSISTELSDCPWNSRHRLVHIGLQGRNVATRDLPPANLVFLLDVSGSMQPANKLPLVKASMKLLVKELRPEDRVAIVVYSGSAGVRLESTPGNHKHSIMQAIDALQAGGSTAGGEGIRLAYQVAWNNFMEGGNNRVILATDGDFNVGVSSDSELEQLIERERETGIYLTVLGFGTGNIKDAKMEVLADKGNGNYAYIDNILEGRRVLVEEMGGTLCTLAKDVKLQIEFNPAQVTAYRLIGYENRMLAPEDFKDDRKDAGELGAGHTVTALYELVPASLDSPDLGVDPLKYQQPRYVPVAGHSDEVMTIKLRYKEPDASRSREIVATVSDDSVPLFATSDNFRFSAAVAQFGMLLKQSQFADDVTYGQVMDLAAGAKGNDPEGYRGEFIRLVSLAETLAETMAHR